MFALNHIWKALAMTWITCSRRSYLMFTGTRSPNAHLIDRWTYLLTGEQSSTPYLMSISRMNFYSFNSSAIEFLWDHISNVTAFSGTKNSSLSILKHVISLPHVHDCGTYRRCYKITVAIYQKDAATKCISDWFKGAMHSPQVFLDVWVYTRVIIINGTYM